jgi:hypothetical protein
VDYFKAVEGRIGRDMSPRTLQAYRARLAYPLEFDGVTPLPSVDKRYFERFRLFLCSRLESDRYVYNVLQATDIFFRTLDITSCVLLRKWQPLTGSITERLISRRPPWRRFGCDRSHLRNFLSHKRRSHSFSMYKCFMNSTESE